MKTYVGVERVEMHIARHMDAAGVKRPFSLFGPGNAPPSLYPSLRPFPPSSHPPSPLSLTVQPHLFSILSHPPTPPLEGQMEGRKEGKKEVEGGV